MMEIIKEQKMQNRERRIYQKMLIRVSEKNGSKNADMGEREEWLKKC
jgi:hypothetical protein